MNDEELRDALRPPDGIEPLDPARVIAGARRRRKRGLAAAGAAAVAVLAVVAGSVIATNGTNGSSGVEPVGTPNSPRTTQRPPSSPTPSVAAADLAACRTASETESARVGPQASGQATLSAAEGTVFIVADSKNWVGCDTGYRQNGDKEVSARKPGPIVKPDVGDVEAFAVAQNLLTKGATQYEYVWAAGVMPDGVKTIRYTFADDTVEDAVVVGKYWLMHHWSPAGGEGATPGKIKVRLLGANGTVLADHELEPGLHTCAQITHGC